MFCYIAGLLIMSVGSNLFLKAALGVAPSCTIALALSEIFPSHSYAVFNFLVNSFLLLCEIAVVKKVEKNRQYSLHLHSSTPCLFSGRQLRFSSSPRTA